MASAVIACIATTVLTMPSRPKAMVMSPRTVNRCWRIDHGLTYNGGVRRAIVRLLVNLRISRRVGRWGVIRHLGLNIHRLRLQIHGCWAPIDLGWLGIDHLWRVRPLRIGQPQLHTGHANANRPADVTRQGRRRSA